jgi:Flp pilus assembly protein TadG
MKRSLKKNRREGAALVEFAICVPVLFLMFFASVEFCRVAMIRHTADNAVYEGCRVGIIPGATAAEVTAEAERVLLTVGISNADIQVTPGAIDAETEEVTVAVSVSVDDNAFLPTQYFSGQSITRQLTLRREGLTGPN